MTKRNCQEVTKIDSKQLALDKIHYAFSFFPPLPLKLQSAESCWGAENKNTPQRLAAVSGKAATTHPSAIT